MKLLLLLLNLTAISRAYVVIPRTTKNHVTGLFQQKSNEPQKLKEEVEHLKAMEHSLETDADLAGLFKHKKNSQKMYMEKEAHKHDSLLNEVEHSIESDPDLSNLLHEDKKINTAYMEHEAHRHDTMLNEIEHSVDTDPFLSP